MKKFLYIGCALFMLSGCNKDFLSVIPQGAISSAIIWNSDVTASMAVNGIYANMLVEHAYGDYTWRFGVWGPDAMDYGGGGMEQGTRDAGSGDFRRRYAYNYQIINRANDAIFNLTDNQNVTEGARNEFIAEAKFLRAFCYFHLWTLYGGVPILDKPTSIQETLIPRNTADEVKALMLKDFTEALAVLPVEQGAGNTGRPTKGAAQAMIGKIYLYSQEWAMAATELGKLMEAPYSYSLVSNYADLFDVKTERNSEVIFALEEIDYPGLGSQNDFRYGGRSLPVSGWSQTVASWATVASYTNKDGSPVDISDMPKASDFANEYDYGLVLIPWYKAKYANVDKRLHANVIMPGYTIIGNGNLEYMMKWPWGEHANDSPYPAYQLDNSDKACFPWRKYVMDGTTSHNRQDAPTNIVLIRYADILLLWAEAKNEADGPSAEIFDAVNSIRDRGEVPHISGLGKDDLRQAIRMERLRELPGEGQIFLDVRRWKTATGTDPFFGLNKVEYDFTMRPLFTAVFTERYYLFAIPQDDMLLNKLLVQNPGWE